jgi:hypothetical protein
MIERNFSRLPILNVSEINLDVDDLLMECQMWYEVL